MGVVRRRVVLTVDTTPTSPPPFTGEVPERASVEAEGEAGQRDGCGRGLASFPQSTHKPAPPSDPCGATSPVNGGEVKFGVSLKRKASRDQRLSIGKKVAETKGFEPSMGF